MEDRVHRPLGDLLEEILDRGAPAYPRFLGQVQRAPRSYRLAVLLGGLCLGREILEVLHEWVARPDSPEKRGLMLGLGRLGHPLAEGYLARLCRERGSQDLASAALRGLGRIRGKKSLPLVIRSLEQPFLRQAACEALERYGGPEAEAALLEHGDDPFAFQALARLGAGGARDRFLASLGAEPPLCEWAAQGIGRLGDPELAGRLVPLIGSDKGDLGRAAFEAYARLGAPEGVEPLLRAASPRPEPWMVEALGWVDDPQVQRLLLASLDPTERRGLLARLLGRRRAAADPEPVYRALRQATRPEVLEELVRRLPETEGRTLRTLLLVQGFRQDPRYAPDLRKVWQREDLLSAYLAARCLLQAPSTEFLAEALDRLQRPALAGLEQLPPGGDPERFLEALAADTNPVVDLASFLDSEILDLGAFEAELQRRLAARAFPSDEGPEARFRDPEERSLGEYLGALIRAQPGGRQAALGRLWILLSQVDDRGDPVLDLFLCWGGAHRGGLQRALFQGLPSALGRWIQGRTDRHLPELDRVAARAPSEGPLTGPIREMLDRARQALQAECRDMVLMLEGSVRGDMVLIEAL